jgi:hypothetical protein
MLTILNYTQALVYTMMDLMPNKYQQKSLRALLGLFLEATGQSLPQHCQTVSSSAISRFLNHYHWPVRAVIRAVRAEIVRQIKAELGVYRWILLSFIAYFLASSAYKDLGKNTLPDWGASAQLAAEKLLPSLVILELLINIKHCQTLARQQGFDITVSGWQYG